MLEVDGTKPMSDEFLCQVLRSLHPSDYACISSASLRERLENFALIVRA